MANRFEETTEFAGDVSFTGSVRHASGSVTNDSVAAGANIAATKVNQRVHAVHTQAIAAVVAAGTWVVYLAHRAGTVLGVRVYPYTSPTGGDLAYAVDVKKSTAGGAFASILTGTVAISSADASLTSQDATLSGTPTVIEDDALAVVVTVSGSTGTQGYGLCVDIIVEENGT